jgi:hypothetical protein
MFFPPFSHPIIVIGSHRSGTSWISKSLADAGVQMGVERDHNEEAWHFLSLNQQAMEKAGGAWDKPLVPREWDWPSHSYSALIKSHFGVHQRRDLWSIWLNQTQWGWKDPRNTFTLTHWLKVFPQARILHVYRNGEEVVKSLMRRQGIEGEVKSEILSNEDAAWNLWEQYVTQARKFSKLSSYLEVDYNELRNANERELRDLDIFTRSEVSQSLLKNLR